MQSFIAETSLLTSYLDPNILLYKSSSNLRRGRRCPTVANRGGVAQPRASWFLATVLCERAVSMSREAGSGPSQMRGAYPARMRLVRRWEAVSFE